MKIQQRAIAPAIALPFALAIAIAFAMAVGGCSGDDNTGDDVTEDVLQDIGATDTGDVTGDDARDDTADDTTDVPPPDTFEPVSDAWSPDAIGLDAAGPADTTELPDGITVRAGSYNLYGYYWATAAAFGELVKSLDVDLMALVESNEDQLDALAAAAGYQYYCSNGDSRSLLSRTPLAACESITLHNGRTILRTETEIGGVTFAVYVVHIDWDIEGNIQVREFMDDYFANETRSHVILMGDYNDEHLSRQISIMEEQLADAFTAFGWYPGERVTWPSIYFDETEGSQTIDLIQFRKSLRPIVLDADAVNLSPNLSDHKPVWAEMLFPTNDTPFPDELTMSKIDPFRVFGDQAADMPANLLVNPGAEDGLDGWTVTGGGVSAESRQGCVPLTGQRFFAGFAKGYTPDDGESRFVQTVDLADYADDIQAGTAWLNVHGHMITCPTMLTSEDGTIVTNEVERYHDAEMTVTFLSSVGAALDRHVSKRRDTLKWYPWADVIAIPPGTAAVEIALIAHKRLDFRGIDAGIDDVYASVTTGAPHGLVAGNLLGLGLNETTVADGTDQTIDNQGWISRQTGTPLSLNGFPPVSVSGRTYLFAGDEIGLNPLETPATVSQEIDLAPLADAIDRGNIALRWGGYFRTNTAEGGLVTMSLQLLDARGDVWAAIPGRTVFESEWMYLENLTMVPPAIKSARILLTAEIPVFGGFLGVEGLEVQDDAVFADELFVRPELVQIPPQN